MSAISVAEGIESIRHHDDFSGEAVKTDTGADMIDSHSNHSWKIRAREKGKRTSEESLVGTRKRAFIEDESNSQK